MFGGREVDLEGLQVAVVEADQPALQPERPVELGAIVDFEEQVKRFQSGEFAPNDFMAFRLRQGVYGQRQPDEQMVRVKAPFGGVTADQLDALGTFAERYAPLNKGHVTTRENFQFHHVPLERVNVQGRGVDRDRGVLGGVHSTSAYTELTEEVVSPAKGLAIAGQAAGVRSAQDQRDKVAQRPSWSCVGNCRVSCAS